MWCWIGITILKQMTVTYNLLFELARCIFWELKYICYICYHDHEIRIKIIIT